MAPSALAHAAFVSLHSQLAQTLYLQMLRRAQSLIPSMVLDNSPKKIKQEGVVPAGSPLFRGAHNLNNSGDVAQVAQAAHDAGRAEFQFDAVGIEVERFKYLAPEEVQPFVRKDGLLDEFKLLYHFRHRFPLHFMVFKQTASHILHEANVEQAPAPPPLRPSTLPAPSPHHHHHTGLDRLAVTTASIGRQDRQAFTYRYTYMHRPRTILRTPWTPHRHLTTLRTAAGLLSRWRDLAPQHAPAQARHLGHGGHQQEEL